MAKLREAELLKSLTEDSQGSRTSATAPPHLASVRRSLLVSRRPGRSSTLPDSWQSILRGRSFQESLPYLSSRTYFRAPHGKRPSGWDTDEVQLGRSSADTKSRLTRLTGRSCTHPSTLKSAFLPAVLPTAWKRQLQFGIPHIVM